MRAVKGAARGQGSVEAFYDQLSCFYHLIFPDWERSMATQAQALDTVIREVCGQGTREVLDATCGIGTQAIGLTRLGYRVTASDASAGAVARARRETAERGLQIAFSVTDLRQLRAHHQRSFDLVLACDNSISHLLSDAEILAGLREFRRCVKPGGGCLLSVRDYASMERSGSRIVPIGVRRRGARRYVVFQVWEFEGAIYDLHQYVLEDQIGGGCTAHVMRSQLYAVTTDRLIELMREVGFVDVRRLDGRFY